MLKSRLGRLSGAVLVALTLGGLALLGSPLVATADGTVGRRPSSAPAPGRPEPGERARASAAVNPFQLILPAETADQAALDVLLDWRSMPSFGDAQYVQFDSHDRHTGVPAPFKLMDNGNRDSNNFICVSPDARVKTSFLVPYIFDLPTCPESYVRGFVMARAEGSGRLARLWLATLTFQLQRPGPKMLRLYVDDAPLPFVQVPLAQALDGSAGEIFAPPFGAGGSDVLAWYYPVVFSTKLVVAVDSLGPLDMLIYHVDVALDPTRRARVAAPDRLPARDAAAAVLGARRDGPGAPAAVLLPPRSATLLPGDSLIAEVPGPATIGQVRVRLSAADVPRLNDVHVSVSWDGGSAAIDQSLGMLLAAALDPPDRSSLALGSASSGDDVIIALRLPMPFADRAQWTLTNNGPVPVSFEIDMTGDGGVPAPPWGYLHTEANTTLAPATTKYHPVANVTGRGRYVGTCLMVEGHQLPPTTFLAEGFNYLEGRVRAHIDGVLRVPGTGTESYVNTGFYFNRGPYGTAFAQGWGMAKHEEAVPFRPPVERGKVSACRWHVLGDAIDFQSSLTVEYEIGPGDPSLLDRYRSVAFYYR